MKNCIPRKQIKFPEIYQLPKQTQVETDNQNGSITNEEIEEVIIKQLTHTHTHTRPCIEGFITEFY